MSKGHQPAQRPRPATPPPTGVNGPPQPAAVISQGAGGVNAALPVLLVDRAMPQCQRCANYLKAADAGVEGCCTVRVVPDGSLMRVEQPDADGKPAFRDIRVYFQRFPPTHPKCGDRYVARGY